MSGQRSLGGGSTSALPSMALEGVRTKMTHLQEKLNGALAEQDTLQRRMHMAARQHKADLSDAQLQIQVLMHSWTSIGVCKHIV